MTQRIEKTTWTREEVHQAIDEGWTIILRCGITIPLKGMDFTIRIDKGHIALHIFDKAEVLISAIVFVLAGDNRQCMDDVIAYTIPKSEDESLHSWTPGNPGTPEQKRAWAEKHKGEKWSLVKPWAVDYFIPNGEVYGQFILGVTVYKDGREKWDQWKMEYLKFKPYCDDYREQTPYEKLIARAYPVSGGA